MATWLPPNIEPICREARAPLTSCSQTGYMFLALVAQLFGNSLDDKGFDNPYSGISHDFGSLTSPAVETSILGPTDIPLGPTPIKSPNIEATPLGPIVPDLLPIKHGYSDESYIRSTFYGKPGFKFEFENQYKNPFSRFVVSRPRNVFDFNLLNRRSDYDIATADSKKVEVKKEAETKKKSSTRKKRHAVEEYDFIVVGAGSAGCVIANRLSEVKKWKVLLLEAGSEEPEIASVPALAPTLGRSSIDWNYRTQPEELTCRAQRGRTCGWLSGRVMGGGSTINYMIYMRGNKRDYDDWARMGNYGWSYSEVLPYFRKSENNQNIESHDRYYHGTGGPLNVERFSYVDQNVKMLLSAFHETGLPLVDFNGERQIGTMTVQTTTKQGSRVSTNKAFIKPIINKRHNLKVITNAQVTKLLIDRHKKVANGVRFFKNNKWFQIFAKKEIILSAGSLNTPKILMLSGIGPTNVLRKFNIPVIKNLKVGYNLQDHATTDAVLMRLTNKTSTALSGSSILNMVTQYAKSEYKDGPLSATGPLQITTFFRTKYANDDHTVPDIQFHFDGRILKEFYGDPTTFLATNIFPLAFYDSINVRPILLLPKSRGYLTLNESDPVFGQPLIYPRFFTVKHDVDTLVDALRFAVQLEDTNAFKENGVKFVREQVPPCQNYVWGTYEYFFCLLTSYTATIFHPAGTCKMGPHWDENAVVDPRLRVYGVKYLRVADASIMPDIVRGNTNAPVIMIGEKVADMIKDDWKSFY